MNKLINLVMLMGGILIFTQCEDDDGAGPTQFEVESITAAGTDFESGEPATDIDLNAATAAENVPLDAVITVEFSSDLDASTVSDTTVMLTSDGDSTTISVTTTGSAVTVTPDEELERGTTYTLTLDETIESSEGISLGDDVSISFKTAGRAEVDPPQTEAQVAYWPFDNNANDAVGNYDATEEVDITYTEDRFGQAESAAAFNGTTSIIEVPEATALVETNDFTLSFWVRADSTDHSAGHFVIGLGGASGFVFEIAGGLANAKLAAQYDLGETSAGEDLWIDATGNTGFQGWVYSKDYTAEGGFPQVLQDNWVNIICVYNSSTKVGSAYVNGVLAKSQDFNLWPENDPKRNAEGLTWAGVAPDFTGTLAFGFITDRESTAFDDQTWGNYTSPDSNHLKGDLDDVRIFHAALSEEEVTALYNGEAP